jgi:transposase
MTAWLSQAPAPLGVAIEVPHGPVVAALLDAGIAVFSINPKQLDRFRDRRSLAGAKDDRLDALTLADALRTDRERFSPVAPLDDLTIALRATSRRRDVLLQDRRRLSNRLYQLLVAAYPQFLALCPAADEPWLWDLLSRLSGPSPSVRTLSALLQRHRIRRISSADLRAALAIPPLLRGPALAAIHDDLATILPPLSALHSASRANDARLRSLVRDAGPTAAILDSMPGIDAVLAAIFLAEASAPLAEHDLQALRSLAGTAPVTHQSGRSRSIRFRRACCPRLRDAVRHWARTAARCDPWASSLYRAMRARGLSHERALRGLADRLLLRLVACLRENVPYDPARASSRPLAA